MIKNCKYLLINFRKEQMQDSSTSYENMTVTCSVCENSEDTECLNCTFVCVECEKRQNNIVKEQGNCCSVCFYVKFEMYDMLDIRGE